MPDFTFHTFRMLLKTLKEQNYAFQSFADFLKNPASRAIILRHDVDARNMNSLHVAKLEAEMDIRGTFNFRMVPQSFDVLVIKQIAALGHEIGYHYEDLTTAKGDFQQAIHIFEQNLAKLRQVASIETICMHGSPLSKYDNRKIWEKYNYRKYDIIGEPYFDLDFNRILYLTDTGRRWDGERVTVRDKITKRSLVNNNGRLNNFPFMSVPGKELIPLNLHSTYDIIKAITNGQFPLKIMITIHPQRWDDNPLPWIRELLWQNLKNVVKRMIAD
jgi:hypothetical protein